MQTYDEATATNLIGALAEKCGMTVLETDIERSDLLETMPIVNLHVDMADPHATFAAMRALEKLINETWGGQCRTGLYYADIGYDEVPHGQGLIQVDLLEFELEKTPRPAAGPRP
jgi:hypothetical protein